MGLGSTPLSSAPPIYNLQQNHYLKPASTPQASLPSVQKINVYAWNKQQQSVAVNFRVKCSQVEVEESITDDEACELVSGTELTIEEEGGDVIQAYLCQAVKNNNETGVLLLSDIFGFQDSATRDLAYRVACNSYNVLVPDLFRGDPWRKGRPMTLLDEWIVKQKPEHVAQAIFASAKWVKNEFAAAGITSKKFGSGVSFYGTRIDSSVASNVKVPLLLITGDGDWRIVRRGLKNRRWLFSVEEVMVLLIGRRHQKKMQMQRRLFS